MRLLVLRIFAILAFAVLAWRFGILQVRDGAYWSAVAANQQNIIAELTPDRGVIYVRDPKSASGTHPVAINRDATTIYSVPRDIVDPGFAAAVLAPILEPDEEARDAKLAWLLDKFLMKDDPYELLVRRAPDDMVEAVRALALPGIGFEKEPMRFYPERSTLAHITGFVGMNEAGERVGRYGVEGFWNTALAGTPGTLRMERGPDRQLIGSAGRSITPADDGADLVLTIDRTVQYVACEKLQATVDRFGAASGSVVIIRPSDGAILAMCNVPTFDPNEYARSAADGVFANAAIFAPYEPGSIFKPFTIAAAIDAGKITPSTTYEDTGEVRIGPYTIRNSDQKANGIQTMTQVLEKSLNTGVIFAVRELGADAFRRYMEDFGFGARTGVELSVEAPGDVSSLARRGDIWSATGSFGQGITTTPIQLAAAYGALANGGKLMRPHIVAEVRHADGTTERIEPQDVRQVISRRAAELTSGMLVRVVEDGHGKRAGVPGYWVGGKTGTAQVAGVGGYERGATIGSFAGYAPVDNPAFAMVVRIDRPQGVVFAESTAAPLFGEIAAFLLHYLEIPPERPIP